jgi:hypothetical protein
VENTKDALSIEIAVGNQPDKERGNDGAKDWVEKAIPVSAPLAPRVFPK